MLTMKKIQGGRDMLKPETEDELLTLSSLPRRRVKKTKDDPQQTPITMSGLPKRARKDR